MEGLNFDLGEVEEWSVSFLQNRWYDIKILFDCENGIYSLWLNGEKVKDKIEFDIETKTLEMMVFRTGAWRSDVRQYLINGEPDASGLDSEDLAGANSKVPKSTFLIDNVKTNSF
jgi:hypothetical protein